MRIDVNRLGEALDSRLARADAALAAQFPGDRSGRQPIHTVYVPADRYRADLCRVWGDHARETLDEHRAVLDELVTAMGGAASDLIERARNKLASEPIEDLRIDFEDGYGARGDDDEDEHVAAAVAALATSLRDGSAAPFYGIRMKCFEAPTRRRGVRTLSLFVSGLVEAGAPLDGFVVTLPKVSSVDQVEAMVYLCAQLEDALSLDTGTLRFEIQIETPQSILGPDGTALVARMVHASHGRCSALHYGTYDYSAFCGIAAEFQSMAHPVADHAKLVMQAAAAGTGVRLSDGSTNVLPVGEEQAIRAGWQLHLQLVRRSLERGYYQGWDLHPAQLPTRYAATIGFYRDGLGRATDRLRRYVDQTGSAILDEPATARALADFILRARHCGAVTSDEVHAATGLSSEQLADLARPRR
ncbi:MAG: aldolase [Actinomycetota bacterium]|nr:aldolase [Actinomycetota bacterium]